MLISLNIKYLSIVALVLLLVATKPALAQRQNEKEQEEVEDRDGKLKAINEKRLEMFYRTAGTHNLSALNYREYMKFRSKENKTITPNSLTPNNGAWSQVNLSNSSWGMGRINCFTFEPGNNTVIYAGTPTGGLWKSSNSGGSWVNLTKALPVPSVSGICIDPGNTNIIYILTGTGSTVENQSIGVFKSIDAGTTWLPTGLDTTYQPQSGIVSWNSNKLLMDPNNSNVLFACMTNGLFKTTDAGDNWTRVFPSTGDNNVLDIEFYPGKSKFIYITTGGGNIFTSNDSGQNFSTAQSVPLNAGSVGYNSTTFAVSPAAKDTIFFALTTPETASHVSKDSVYIGRGRYDTLSNTITFGSSKKCFYPGSNNYVTSALRWYRDARLAVSPLTTANMYIGGLDTYSSNNYGNSWIFKSKDPLGNITVHTDCSRMQYVNGVVYTSNDGGLFTQAASESTATSSWSNLNGTMSIAQIIKIGISQVSTTDFVLALQDNGCHIRTASTYTLLQSGDGGVARMDPNNAALYYGSYAGGGYNLTRYLNGVALPLDPTATYEPYGSGYPFLPFEINQISGKNLFAAYKALYKSADTGKTWYQFWNHGTQVTKLLALSKSTNIIWMLENITFIMRKSVDGGFNFNTVSIPAEVPIAQISAIIISPFDDNLVYLTIDGYSQGKKIYMTPDGGLTWQNISFELPNVPIYHLAYENSIDNSIYVGTEIGVYYRNDVINKWISFNNGMPLCRISELYMNRTAGKIIAGTYGCGIFISDYFGTCDATVTLSGNINGLNTYSAGTQLTSTQNITGGYASNIKYYAGSVTFMQPGFFAPTGTRFVAGIASCGGADRFDSK